MPSLPNPGTQGFALHELVASLILSSRTSRKEIVRKAGLSKDQVSRSLRGSRAMSSSEALALLEAAGLPAKGALTLVLYGRFDLVTEWATSGLGAFLETLVSALPEALPRALGEVSDRVDPRWGTLAARFLAERIASHVEDLMEREQRLADSASFIHGQRHH